MAKFAFDLVSPERLLLSLEAESVSAPGTEGDFGVYAGHAPMVASLRSGVVVVTGTEDGDHRIYIAGPRHILSRRPAIVGLPRFSSSQRIPHRYFSSLKSGNSKILMAR